MNGLYTPVAKYIQLVTRRKESNRICPAEQTTRESGGQGWISPKNDTELTMDLHSGVASTIASVSVRKNEPSSRCTTGRRKELDSCKPYIAEKYIITSDNDSILKNTQVLRIKKSRKRC